MIEENIKEQFLNILEKNIGILLKVSKAYTKIAQDREDLINDITFELWKSFKNFKGHSKISTWIYRVAFNTSMNYIRKKRNDSMFISLNDFKKEDIYQWFAEEDNSAELEALYDSINELDEINKAIILLYLDGNSHDEISEIMGISKTNVGTRIGRIKEQLRNFTITNN